MKYYGKPYSAGAKMLLHSGEKASCLKKWSYLQNYDNKHLAFLLEGSGPLLQTRGRRIEATARARLEAARAPLQPPNPRRFTLPRPRPPLRVQSFAGLLRACRGEGGADRRTQSASPRPPARPPARPSFCPARPGQSQRRGRRARARARRRSDSPSERPRPACALRAGGLRLFEQEGGHISPSRPPSPHPPQAFATATRLLQSRGRSPSQKLPHQQQPGPDSRLPHRQLSSLSSPKSPSLTDLALSRRTPR